MDDQNELLDSWSTMVKIRESTMPFYVYALCDPHGTPFYVGKGTGSRVLQHETDADCDANTLPRHDKIREIKKDAGCVRYKLAGFFIDEDEAFEEEKKLIAIYGRRDKGSGILLNQSDGGEGRTPRSLEKWVEDESGILIAKERLLPSPAALKQPKFGDGDSKPKLAEWHGSGLSIQVFLDQDINVVRESNATWGKPDDTYAVDFRFFEGKQLLIEDRTGFRYQHLLDPVIMISAMLFNFATIPEPWNNHIRFDMRYGRKDYSAGLQVWIRHNSICLRGQAKNLLSRHSLSVEELPKIKRPYRTSTMAKNIVRFR